MFIPIGGVSPAAVRTELLTQGCSQLLMFLLPALAFAWFYKGNAATFHCLDFGGRKWFLAFVAVVIFVLMMPFNDWLTWWNDHWDLGAREVPFRRVSDESKASVERMLSLSGIGDLVLQLIVVALIPAVCEEFFFRGALQQILRDWFGNKHVAVIVTAVVFTLAHGDLYGCMPRLVLGLLLGYLFFLSGSMLVNVCAHFFNNAAFVIIYYLYHRGILLTGPTSPMLMPWPVVISCGIGAALLIGVYFAKKSVKNETKSNV